MRFRDETNDIALGYDDSSHLETPSEPGLDSAHGTFVNGSESLSPPLTSVPEPEVSVGYQIPIQASPLLPLHYSDSSSLLHDVSATGSEQSPTTPNREQIQPITVKSLLCRSSTDSTYMLDRPIVLPTSSSHAPSPLYCEVPRTLLESRKYAILLRHFKIAIGNPWVRIFSLLRFGATSLTISVRCHGCNFYHRGLASSTFLPGTAILHSCLIGHAHEPHGGIRRK